MKLRALFERASPLSKSVAQKIINDCKPFIHEVIDIDENRLYRGLKLDSFARRAEEVAEDVYRATVRKDRVPLNTPEFIHTFMDEWMEKELGRKFRSESIFCAADRQTVLNFGKPYVILPIGEFAYAWSPFIEDVFSDVEEISHADKRDGRSHDESLEKIKSVLENAKYETTDLGRAIRDFPTHEIMVDCKEYYAFEPSVFSDYFYNYYRMLA